MIDERTKLIDYINAARNITFEKEKKKINDFIQYQLSNVLNSLEDNYIISVIYGRLFKIVCQHNKDIYQTYAVGIFYDLAQDIFGKYFFICYIKHKN